ncbi:DUF1217 domain-containing protein [Algimonas porphyrae]|uniref:Flagellar protein n=1 Tax=Algimonas porphyrae TaxID=1128113 RepID=A0ABQ5V4A0_9PROT|nr:DUF1217 domain-containing protein [Algimonas porphyrae]GLQ21426.1 flagellar protein [Algimonas porphyrae]
MPIPPSLIGGSLPGWAFLQETRERQQATFESSTDIQRNVDGMREKLTQPFTLDELMGDRQLLRPVLQSFGLQDEIDKGAFIRRIISDGPDDPQGFARRLNNTDFIELSRTFEADPDGLIRLSDTEVDNLIQAYQDEAFEVAVGEQEPTLRLALNFEQEIGDLARDAASDRSFWFKVIGSAPLMEVFQAAFILPDGFANLDVDKQADYLQNRAEQQIGSDPRAILATDEGVQTTVRKFILQTQLQNGPDALTPGASALTLLSAGAGFGSQSLSSLILSNAV